MYSFLNNLLNKLEIYLLLVRLQLPSLSLSRETG
jgi:hypothetical protein